MHPKDLHGAAQRILADKADKVLLALDEVTVECRPEHYLDIMQTLRDHEEMHFELLVDLCGVDYSTYKNEPWSGKRFAVVSQLLSVRNNQRIRVRVWAENDDFPLVQSVINIYNSADWYEREAFDMYGIVSKTTPTCAASSPTTALSAIPSAKISPFPAMSKCVTTKPKNALSISL